jgi:hypothetical protein
MTKDDQRARETVQAELRRRRSALDGSEDERADRLGTTANGYAARAPSEERRSSLRRQWSLPSDPTGD